VNIKIEVSHTQMPPGFYKVDFTLLDDFAFLDDPGTLDLLDLTHVSHTHTHTIYMYIYINTYVCMYVCMYVCIYIYICNIIYVYLYVLICIYYDHQSFCPLQKD